MAYIHPRLRIWLDIAEVMLRAVEAAAAQGRHAVRRVRSHSGCVRRQGEETPLWNAFSAELRTALQSYGSKARLARYLGIPKQRVSDFLRGQRRLPDAELTLRMLYWLAERRAGRDPAL